MVDGWPRAIGSRSSVILSEQTRRTVQGRRLAIHGRGSVEALARFGQASVADDH